MGQPLCDRNQVDAGLNQVRGLGVSTFFPIHKFDNAFGGTKMDSGEVGSWSTGATTWRPATTGTSRPAPAPSTTPRR